MSSILFRLMCVLVADLLLPAHVVVGCPCFSRLDCFFVGDRNLLRRSVLKSYCDVNVAAILDFFRSKQLLGCDCRPDYVSYLVFRLSCMPTRVSGNFDAHQTSKLVYVFQHQNAR